MKNSRLEVGHEKLQALKLKKSALSEKNKNLSQFMKMKAQKEQNEQKQTEFVFDLNESITYLESLLNDDDNKLAMFDTDSNSYTPSFNLCVMNLLIM